MRKLPNSYSIKKDNFESSLDSIKILFLGSSEPLDDIDPGQLDAKGYNLAALWQRLYYDKELTLRYVDRMPDLKIVFISISTISKSLSIIS